MYAATVQGQRLTFDAEAVWRRNMIMRDRETGTLWQQATGEGLAGPLAGERLRLLGGEQMTWVAWRAENPDTLVALGPDEWPGMLPLPLTERVLEVATRSGWVPGRVRTDERLPQNEEIAGVRLRGEARAYPLAALRTQGVINDDLGGMPIALVYAPAGDRVRAFHRPGKGPFRKQDGKLTTPAGETQWNQCGQPLGDTPSTLIPIHVRRQWWNAWYEFHPGTTVWSQ